MKTGNSIGSVGAKVANVGAGVASIGAVGLGALSWPLTLAANAEAAETAIGTMLQDTERARKLFAELREFSAETPFSLGQITEAAKLLLSFGSSANEVQDELRRLGDIAAVSGQSIDELAALYGKAKVNGRLFADDMTQWNERMVPLTRMLANEFGVSEAKIKEMVSAGEIGFKELDGVIRRLTDRGGMYFEGAKTAATKFWGLLSTFKDNIGQALAPLGNSLLPAMKEILQVGTNIAQAIGGWVEANKAFVKPLAAGLAGVTAIGAATAVAGIGLIGIGSAISSIVTIGSVVGPVISAIGAPAIGIFAASTAGAMALYGALGYVTHQAGLLMPALKFLKSGFSQVWGVAGETFSNITAALKAGEWQLAAKVAWSGIKLATLTGARHVLEGVDSLWNNLGDITWRFLKSLMQAFGQVFSSLPKIAWAAVRGKLALDKFILETLGTVLTGDNLNLAAKLDPMLNKARIEFGQSKQQVAALNNRPAQQRRVGQVQSNNRIGRVGQQQRRMPQNMPPAARAYQQRLQQARQYEARRAQQHRIAMQQQAMRRRPPNALANRPMRPQQQIHPAQMQQMLQHMQRQTQLQQQLVNEGGLG